MFLILEKNSVHQEGFSFGLYCAPLLLAACDVFWEDVRVPGNRARSPDGAFLLAPPRLAEPQKTLCSKFKVFQSQTEQTFHLRFAFGI